MKRLLVLLFSTAIAMQAMSQGEVKAQAQDSTVQKLMSYAVAASNFGNALPQEKVYLHFDNTSYYQGDHIWFQAYVVAAGKNTPTQLSRTLYVELLNPGGTIVDKRILRVVNGRCHGDFSLTQLPFYSGFYEIRAYTKYMLNFGEETIFSRVVPVFDTPQQDGDYAERRMLRFDTKKYPQKRDPVKKDNKVNIKFYPEGGSLVYGLQSRVAFEATDEIGNPIEQLKGRITNKAGAEVATFTVTHEGRGTFDYTPSEGDKAEVGIEDRTYSPDLPKPLAQGVTFYADNISSPDSLTITLRRSPQLPVTVLGAAVISGGKLISYNLLDLTDAEPLSFVVDKRKLPAGVSRVVIADTQGQIVADRLVFRRLAKSPSISVSADKPSYNPYDSVSMDIAVRDAAGNPLITPVSFSVRDGDDEVSVENTLLSDLLLTSEIRGYVHRPLYYFESDDAEHRTALDQLLMIQGWRRYSWDWWAGLKPFDLKYMPELGIEVHGQVVHYSTNNPMTGIQLSSILMRRGEEDNAEKTTNSSHLGIVDVDSTGHFDFITNAEGKWTLALSVTNDKNKRKASRILIDRAFSPKPSKYRISDIQVRLPEKSNNADNAALKGDTTAVKNAADTTSAWQYYDDDDETDMTKKVYRIEEVVVKGEKHTEEEKIYHDRSTSVAYYDIPSEIDSIKDSGLLIKDINELMARLNDKFYISRSSVAQASAGTSIDQQSAMSDAGIPDDAIPTLTGGGWTIRYKNKQALFIVDHQTRHENLRHADLIKLSAIKSIYINEEPSVIIQYSVPDFSPDSALSTYSCVVFLETFAEHEVPVEAGRGVRKTWLDGYNAPDEFYMPDYSVLPKEADYRRTLYWNPELMPDEQGKATVKFYNNGKCRKMRVSADALTDDGNIVVLEE